jgi:hypothetical protein
MKKIILGIFLSILLCSYAYAAPVIIGKSGTMLDGQTITITSAGGATGFGATGPTVRIFDNFSSGTPDASITSAFNAVIGTWGVDNAWSPSLMHFRNTYSHDPGGISVEMSTVRAVDDPPRDPRIRYESPSGWASGDKALFSFWFFIPSGDLWPGDGSGAAQLKVMWLWYDNDNVGPVYAWNYTPGSYSYFYCLNGSYCNSQWIGCPEFGSCGIPNDIFVKGTWSRYLFYFDFKTNATGVIEAWEINANHGRTRLTTSDPLTGVVTIAPGAPAFGRVYFPGFSRHTPSGTQRIFYDDLYVADGPGARARVEIGNQSSYSACTNLAIFTPTSWGDTSITATMRAGSFGTSGTAWLFVTDANGVTSTGYSVTLGSGGGDTTPPTITITSPTSSPTYSTEASTITISGNATDDVGVTQVGAINSANGIETSCYYDDVGHGFICSGVPLVTGSNPVTVYGNDAIGHQGTDLITISVTSVPPVISGLSPSGAKQCDANYWPETPLTLACNTDESATCKYATSDVSYDTMGQTFSITGGTTHSQSITFQCGSSYIYYVRCMDAFSNKNTTSSVSSFTLDKDPPPRKVYNISNLRLQR